MLVKYFADVRTLTGVLEQEWGASAPTLRDLLLGLAQHHGDAFGKRILPAGQLSDSIIVLVDGRNVIHLKGLETPLRADTVVSVFPIVAGG